jgi:hypothetical protein
LRQLGPTADSWFCSSRKPRTAGAGPTPEPTTGTLWSSPNGPGLLTRHTCTWEARHPAQENNRGFPHTDRSPLAAAVADALDGYDVIVLLPRYWSYPDREIAAAHVVLGEVDISPDTDCRTALPGGAEKSVPLSSEQSAAAPTPPPIATSTVVAVWPRPIILFAVTSTTVGNVTQVLNRQELPG